MDYFEELFANKKHQPDAKDIATNPATQPKVLETPEKQ